MFEACYQEDIQRLLGQNKSMHACARFSPLFLAFPSSFFNVSNSALMIITSGAVSNFFTNLFNRL